MNAYQDDALRHSFLRHVRMIRTAETQAALFLATNSARGYIEALLDTRTLSPKDWGRLYAAIGTAQDRMSRRIVNRICTGNAWRKEA